MPSLDMKSLYDFTCEKIDEVVESGKIGNFALGDINESGLFHVKYVGRSDMDLRRELKQHMIYEYSKFKFSYAGSLEEAYLKECRNYHDFKPVENSAHPVNLFNNEQKCCYCAKEGSPCIQKLSKKP